VAQQKEGEAMSATKDRSIGVLANKEITCCTELTRSSDGANAGIALLRMWAIFTARRTAGISQSRTFYLIHGLFTRPFSTNDLVSSKTFLKFGPSGH
jgi:hypothetical protein